jgi:(1->4)-alpha-D-glucan 1-alpha-D-glucosylmutase
MRLLEKRAANPAALLGHLDDGRAKLHVIRQGLAVRKAHPALFHGGEYRPLYADAGYEEQLIAFSLSAGGQTLVALAPRLFARRLGEAATPVGAYWSEARLVLPEGEYHDAISGRAQRGGARRLSEVLTDFPVALLVQGSKNRSS